MSDKTIAEVLMAKMRYEGKIERFLRETVEEFIEETGVPVDAIEVDCERVLISGFVPAERYWKLILREAQLKLHWEGAGDDPVP